MATVRIVDQAEKEFDLIQEYLREIGAEGFAETLELNFLAITRRLEVFPRMGRMVPEIEDSSLREVIYRNYRIIYVVNDEASEVKILTILHSSQQFGEPPSQDG